MRRAPASVEFENLRQTWGLKSKPLGDLNRKPWVRTEDGQGEGDSARSNLGFRIKNNPTMESFWHQQGRRVALRVNGARWLEFAVPAMAGASVLAGCALLMLRRHDGWNLFEVRASLAATGMAAVLLIAGIGWLRVRRNWFSAADGLVRLEAVLGLHNRLSSAAAGIGEWPPARAKIDDGLRWRLPRLLAPLLFGAAFVTAAIFFPISREAAGPAPKLEPPLAWSQVEAALNELQREEAASPEAMAEIERKLESLRSQPEEAWYSQASLEAGDALRQETGSAIAALKRQLESAAQSLAGQTGPSLQSLSSEEAAARWNEALRGLESGALPFNPAELAKLKQLNLFDPKAAATRQFSPEQLRQLESELQKKAGASAAALGKVSDALANAQFEEGLVGEEPGEKGLLPGVGPGGDHVPLKLKAAPVALSPDHPQPLEGVDPTRVALGDKLGTTAGAPKPDPEAEAARRGRGPVAGGSAASSGAGGEAVWKNELSPAEQEVLRGFFK